MTRDPNRIDPILSRLRAAWQRSPDLRLGQLIVGSIPIGHLDRADAIRRLFNAECHEFGAAGAPVEWPAPPTAAQPPPALDLDALAEAERAMTVGPWRWGDWGATFGRFESRSRYTLEHAPAYPIDACAIREKHHEAVRILTITDDAASESNAAGIVALRNAAPHLIAEARAAVALRQELAALRAHFDAAAPEHNLPALLDLYNDRTTEAREKLAEAKRLGLEAVKLSRDAIEAARMAPVDEPAATVVAIGCLNAADRIAAALEAM